jgi:hypothetical protein
LKLVELERHDTLKDKIIKVLENTIDATKCLKLLLKCKFKLKPKFNHKCQAKSTLSLAHLAHLV